MGLSTEDFTKLPQFDWDKAKIFYYVAKLGSITEAGKFLTLSQPTISRSIGILEDELNCKLLTRHSGGIKLTRKGEELFAEVEKFFLNMKKFSYSHAAMSKDGQKRRIRISTTQPIAAYVLNEYLAFYNELNPDIIFELNTNDHLIDIAINDVDMVIRPYDPEAKGICQEHLFTLVKRLYASSRYLMKYGEPKTVDDLINHRIIAYSHPETRPYADLNWSLRLGMPEGKTQEPVYSSDSLECLVDMAQKGLGIFACYEEMSIIKNSGLKNILPEVEGTYIQDFIIYPEYMLNDKVFMDFKNYLRDKFGNLKG